MISKKKKWFNRVYQISIRDANSFEQKYVINLSYLRAIFYSLSICTILLSISLLLINTIMAKWLHPEYIQKKNKDKILELNAIIDSLERDVANQSNFIKVIQNVIDGKNDEASLEAYKMYTDYYNSISHKEDFLNNPNVNHLIFFRPALGVVTNKFNPDVSHYGIDIAAEEGQSIKNVADGVVTMSSWTSDTGGILIIQHSNNLISIYKHCSLLLKKVGNFVKQGELIGTIGNSGELSSGPHLHFELWYDGNPVNPELFIKIN